MNGASFFLEVDLAEAMTEGLAGWGESEDAGRISTKTAKSSKMIAAQAGTFVFHFFPSIIPKTSGDLRERAFSTLAVLLAL